MFRDVVEYFKISEKNIYGIVQNRKTHYYEVGGQWMCYMPATESATFLQTGGCSSIPILDKSVDYIFTDSPFGENIYYAGLNFLVESWHPVLTNPTSEAIVDQEKKKGGKTEVQS